MVKLSNKKAFSLIEILVVIAVIAILVMGTSLNFNILNDRQKLDSFGSKIIFSFEGVRNNSLIGKGIGTNLDVPKNWKIEYSLLNSGSLTTYYDTGAGLFTKYEQTSLVPDNFYSIESLKCLDRFGTNPVSTQTGIIYFIGSNLSLSGCSDNSKKELEIEYKFKSYTGSIIINTLNGLIDKKR